MLCRQFGRQNVGRIRDRLGQGAPLYLYVGAQTISCFPVGVIIFYIRIIGSEY